MTQMAPENIYSNNSSLKRKTTWFESNLNQSYWSLRTILTFDQRQRSWCFLAQQLSLRWLAFHGWTDSATEGPLLSDIDFHLRLWKFIESIMSWRKNERKKIMLSSLWHRMMLMPEKSPGVVIDERGNRWRFPGFPVISVAKSAVLIKCPFLRRYAALFEINIRFDVLVSKCSFMSIFMHILMIDYFFFHYDDHSRHDWSTHICLLRPSLKIKSAQRHNQYR